MHTSQAPQRILNGIDLGALQETIATVGERPELGATTFRAESHWVDSRRIATTIDSFSAGGGEHRRPAPHELLSDLPEALGGTDQGPSPLEVALAALGSCVATTLVVHAAAKGVPLRAASVKLSGELDLRGFLNLAEVRTGYERLKLDITLDADLTDEEIASFVQSGLRFSPVLDLLRHGTEIETSTTREPAGQVS